MTTKMAIYYRYVGGGHFVEGVPARDLTEQEFNELSKELQERIAATELYEFPASSQPKSKPETKKEGE